MFAWCQQSDYFCVISLVAWFHLAESSVFSLPKLNEIGQINGIAGDSRLVFYLRDEIFAPFTTSRVLHRAKVGTLPPVVHNFSLPLISGVSSFTINSIDGNYQDDTHMVSERKYPGGRHFRRIPDVTDKESVLSFARMAANAYTEDPSSDEWIEVGAPWNRSLGIGWDSDGVRGQVFVATARSVVVIALKGTTTLLSTNGSDTYENDKINDNLLFSCCCGRVSFGWATVCDCYSKDTYTCSQTCLERELKSKDKYYEASLRVYHDVAKLYPSSSIWLTGHSLAASLSSLIAQTHGVPAVVFAAPGEKLAASRLHLPTWLHPDSEKHVWHFGNSADPLFMGTCNGPLSICAIGGYAMESQCHSGLECVYDTVNDKDYEMSLTYHRIEKVIEIIDEYDKPAACSRPMSCQDCYLWNFIRD
ncbi:Alpha/Beta hydrolase protein [Lipomyces orientalis]|uniref:Alpha/Beta hydrolase protein n=1 Tax=Lipomyces orientalis TaxID=1233043 RepID=A0ACC3TJX3_9ASCO